jgi:hypothetical protein
MLVRLTVWQKFVRLSTTKVKKSAKYSRCAVRLKKDSACLRQQNGLNLNILKEKDVKKRKSLSGRR